MTSVTPPVSVSFGLDRSTQCVLLLAVAVAVSGCSTAPGSQKVVKASPGFKGKDCEMVSPNLDPSLTLRGKPVRLKARAHFVDGVVTKVEILSGPREYRQVVIDAMKQYTCKGGLTFFADQNFVFGLDPLSAKVAR